MNDDHLPEQGWFGIGDNYVIYGEGFLGDMFDVGQGKTSLTS